MTYQLKDIQDILEIYHFTFISDPNHLQYLLEQYIINGHYLCQETRLFLPSSVTDIPDTDILEHIVRRIPVYFGEPKNDLFSWESLKNILGYDYHNLQIEPKLISNIRYAISGPINIMATEEVSETRAWVTHLWGVNFETNQTDDYKILYQEKGELDIDAYLDRQLDIFNLVFKSAKYAGKKEMAHKVQIQMPMVGMGQFLKALDERERQVCQMLFIEALEQTVGKHSDMTLKLCLFQPDEFSGQCLTTLTQMSEKYPNLKLGLGPKDGNMLLGVENADPNQDKPLICLVNAWDPRSFIGNGGSLDKTIDGFIVANAGGFNDQCRNSSYLHNAFFCPQVINPKRWLVI